MAVYCLARLTTDTKGQRFHAKCRFSSKAIPRRYSDSPAASRAGGAGPRPLGSRPRSRSSNQVRLKMITSAMAPKAITHPTGHAQHEVPLTGAIVYDRALVMCFHRPPPVLPSYSHLGSPLSCG